MGLRLQPKWFALAFLFAGLMSLPVLAQNAPGGKELNWDEFVGIVGNAKFVNFGEDSHFMTDVHKFVSQAFPRLAEKKGFRVFVFESAWGIEDAFRDFMNSDRVEVTADESYFLNAFNSKNIVKMLIWIREWNRNHPNDKIQIAGYQPEQPVTDFTKLWEFLGKADKFPAADLRKKAESCRASTGEFKTDIEFISSTGKRRRSGQPTYTTEERAACNQAINAIEAFIEENKAELIKKNSLNAYRESLLHSKSLRTYLNTLSAALDYGITNKTPTLEEQRVLTKKIYEEGDKTRFEIFEVLRQTRYANKKIFFWMHNWHAMKHAPEVEAFGRDEKDGTMPAGTISIGTRMAATYGKQLVVIGNIVPKAVCKNPVCTPPPVRADSLETKFAEHFGAGSALVYLLKPARADRTLPLATPGSLYADINQGHFANVVLKRQFDAILYLSESGATFEEK